MNIKDRVCPSCGEKIGLYSAMGLYMPIEDNAYRRIIDSEKEKSQNPFIPIGLSSQLEWYSIVLSSTCNNCGHISLWKATKNDLDILCKGENVSKDFGFWQSYEIPVLKRIINNIEDPRFREYISNLLDEILKIRGK